MHLGQVGDKEVVYQEQFKRGEAPLFYIPPPLLLGEGDKGGEVDR